jgi:hypothetical protein
MRGPGRATYHDGPAAQPDVIIKTPAAIWLAVAAGELDGAQAHCPERQNEDRKQRRPRLSLREMPASPLTIQGNHDL